MGDVSAEPSMEDILSSIKRIIAEEGEASAAPARNRRVPRGRPQPDPMPAAFAEHAEDDDEILELDDPVPMSDERPVAARESILSAQTAEASRGALEALSRMIVKPEATGSDTLEGLVREMLRPMLREWLDANLPGMVDQMVAKEIARITGQAG